MEAEEEVGVERHLRAVVRLVGRRRRLQRLHGPQQEPRHQGHLLWPLRRPFAPRQGRVHQGGLDLSGRLSHISVETKSLSICKKPELN